MLCMQGDAAAANFWKMVEYHKKDGVQELGIPVVMTIKHGSNVFPHCSCFNCTIGRRFNLECVCPDCILSHVLGLSKPDAE